MKIIGFLLIISAFSAVGFFKAFALKSRTSNLREIKTVLENLCIHIGFGKNHLSEAVLNSVSGKNTEKLFTDFAKAIVTDGTELAWQKSLDENMIQLNLSGEDKESLMPLSKELGKTDVENQIRHIRYISELLELQIQKADAEYAEKFTLYKNAGVALGVFAALMMM